MANDSGKSVLRLYTPTLNKYTRPRSGLGGVLELQKAAQQSFVAASLAGHLETSLVSGSNQLKVSSAGLHLALTDIFPKTEYLKLVEIPLPPGRQVTAGALRKLAQLLDDPSGSRLLNYQANKGTIQLLGLAVEKFPELLAELPPNGRLATGELEESQGRVEFCRSEDDCPWALIKPAPLAALLSELLAAQGYDFSGAGFRIAINGCPQDCLRAWGRYDLILTGAWRGDLILNVQASVSDRNCWAKTVKGCPAGKLELNDEGLSMNQEPCRHCGRCLKFCPQSVYPPADRGVAVLSGGLRLMGRSPGRPRSLKSFHSLTTGIKPEQALGDLLITMINFWVEKKNNRREFFDQTINRLNYSL